MATLGVDESILRQISANDVFEELKASDEINSAYMEMLMSIKKTDAYKSLRNVAVDHISGILTSKKDTLLEASIQKRKQIFEIQRMIRNIDSTISEKISERLRKEDSKIAIRKAIKRLSNKRQNVESIKKSPGSPQVEHKSIVEELCKNFNNHKEVFSGAVVLMSGDFRLTLPVIPRSTFAQEMNACLKESFLWQNGETLRLTINMRVHLQDDQSGQILSNQLLDIGNSE
ncbi:ATP-dependent DNA helicase [Trichonephila clavipes]|nr:ATP-dependent DNA helicase [Trichonephila clavipes]